MSAFPLPRPLLLLLLGLFVAGTGVWKGGHGLIQDRRQAETRARAAFAGLPLFFEANEGQADPRVRFLSRAGGLNLFLAAGEAVLSLAPERPSRDRPVSAGTAAPASVRMRLLGGNEAARMSGVDRLPGTTSYFIGDDPSRWREGVALYGKVRYEAVYPGIDLVYYGNRSQLEYDFIVAPGADPRQIRLAFEGADGAELDPTGDLVLRIGERQVRQRKPLLYQEIAGRRQPVTGAYVLDEGRDGPQIGFAINGYDPAHPLVIDPVLTYSSYLGGNGAEVAWDIHVDDNGIAYVGGEGNSSTFPTRNAYQEYARGKPWDGTYNAWDLFLTKLDTTKQGGEALLYSTWIGGNSHDLEPSIAVDGSGNAYICGFSTSSNFPVVRGYMAYPGDKTSTGLPMYNAVLARIDTNAAGIPSLVYSTYFGGKNDDGDCAVATGESGRVYLAGYALSSNLPLKRPYSTTYSHTYLAEFDTVASGVDSLLYSTQLPLSSCKAVAYAGSGVVYVAGHVDVAGKPVVGGYQGHQGDHDVWLGKLDTTTGPDGLLYSTYLGGTGREAARGISVDSLGNAYVVGETASADFPVVNAYQGSYAGGKDAFLARIDTTATGAASLVYSTYLGGTGEDQLWSVAAADNGLAWCAGWTVSTDFPLASPLMGDQPDYDAVVALVNTGASGGASLPFSTYLGGNHRDTARGVALDGAGQAYVAGWTKASDFPTVLPFQNYLNDTDKGSAFLARIVWTPPSPFGLTATAAADARRIDIRWVDGYFGEDGFSLERKGPDGDWREIATPNANSVAYADTSVALGATYHYRLRVLADPDDSGYSQEVSATVGDIPPAPGDLRTAEVGPTHVRLTWADRSSNEARFYLERKVGSEAWEPIATPAADATSFADTDRPEATRYLYRLRAGNSFGYSSYTAETEAITLLAAPESLAAGQVSGTEIRFSWRDNSAAEEGFQVEASTDGGVNFSEVGGAEGSSGTGGTATFIHADLTTEATYRYRVRAYSSLHGGVYSAFSPVAGAELLNAPADLTVQASTSTVARLNWKDRSAREKGFTLERRAGDGDWAVDGTTRSYAGTGTTVVLSRTGLTPETPYRYRVRAFNDAGASPFSPEAEIIPLAAPTGLTVKPITASAFELSWKDNSAHETAYRVEVREGTAAFRPLEPAPSGDGVGSRVTVTRAGFSPTTRCTFRVQASSATAASHYSNAVAVTALPAPTTLRATMLTTETVQLRWLDQSRVETGFRVEYRQIGGEYRTLLIAPAQAGAGTAVVATGSGLEGNRRYQFRAFAVAETGGETAESLASTPTEVQTLSAPEGLTAIATSAREVRLTWQDRSDGETLFKLEAKIGTGAWKAIPAAEPVVGTGETVSVLRKGLLPGAECSFRVRASNAGGHSSYSGIAMVTMPRQ